MKTNQDFKNEALGRLRGNWPSAVAAAIIVVLVSLVASGSSIMQEVLPGLSQSQTALFGGASLLATFFIIGPLEFGSANAFRKLYETGDGNVVNNLWSCTVDNYLRNVAGFFCMTVKLFLWFLLFIIPGMVMSFSYAMTPFILADHPEMSAWKASSESRRIMKGHKFDLFYLWLSFIGWGLLSVFTCGIGFLWLTPYVNTATAAFYNEIKD